MVHGIQHPPGSSKPLCTIPPPPMCENPSASGFMLWLGLFVILHTPACPISFEEAVAPGSLTTLRPATCDNFSVSAGQGSKLQSDTQSCPLFLSSRFLTHLLPPKDLSTCCPPVRDTVPFVPLPQDGHLISSRGVCVLLPRRGQLRATFSSGSLYAPVIVLCLLHSISHDV